MAYDYRAARDWVFGICRKESGMIEYVGTDATARERLLLLALVEFAPNMEPSVAALASMSATDERTVRRLLRTCEAKGFVRVDCRTGARNHYTLAYPGRDASPDTTPPLAERPPSPGTAPGVPRAQRPPKQTNKADKKAGNTSRARAQRSKPVEVPLPEDFEPTAANVAYASKYGLDLEFEVDGLRGWAVGRTAVSWHGVLATRLANAAKWKRERAGSAPRKAPAVQRGAAEGVNMAGANTSLFDDVGGAK